MGANLFLPQLLTHPAAATWRAFALLTPQVYPIGIPLLYAYILWKNRDSLNPRPRASAGGESGSEDGSPAKTQETLEETLKRRRENPDLVPSMFLWKDFGEKRCTM